MSQILHKTQHKNTTLYASLPATLFQFLFLFISCFLPSPMAASSNLHHHKNNSSTTFDPSISLPIPNTTFVQANPSNFRAVVQKLTGAPPPQDSLSVPKPTRLAGKSNSGEMGPRRPVFKLHERRLQSAARKLEIKLNDNGSGGGGLSQVEYSPSSSSSVGGYYGNKIRSFSTGFGNEMFMVSPVSPLELLGRGSPRTPPYKSSSSSPMAMEDEEMKGIVEKGFYLHPSPLSTPRGGGGGAAEPPELLPLFPLHSPTTDHHTSN